MVDPTLPAAQTAATAVADPAPVPEPKPAAGLESAGSGMASGKASVGESLSTIAAGAVTGAVTGGGLQGAAIGAGKALLRTRHGRMLLVGLLVLAVSPLFGLLALINMIAGAVPVQEDAQLQQESEQTVLESSSVTDSDLGVLQDVGQSTGVPWQVLAAMMTGSTASGATGTATVIVPDDMTCPETGKTVEDGLTASALLVLRCGAHEFPEITSWGGVGERTNNPDSDHPAGRAVDAMIPDWDTTEGNDFGWEVANWYRANAQALGIRYVLFDSMQWSVGDADWSAYTHPSGGSSPTLNHEDHVHVSVLADGGTSTSGSASQTQSSGSGLGPFGISPGAGLSDSQAQDLRTSASWVAGQLKVGLSGVSVAVQHLGNGAAVLDDGSRVVAVAPQESTGQDGEYVNVDMAVSATRTEEAWAGAIGGVDVVGMTQARAVEVFTTARNWYLGIASGNGGGSCVSSADGSSVTTLESQTQEGTPVTLTAAQLQVASVIIGQAEQAGVGQAGAVVGLMTALQESTLRNLANDGSDTRLSAQDRDVVMASLDFPNDGIGSDWDSVNPFQQRPSQGWGTVDELMDSAYAAKTFFERLVAVDGWADMEPTVAAQTVQRSAYPDAYAKWAPVAQDIVAQVGGVSCSAASAVFSAEGWTYPLPVAGRITSVFGPRLLFGNSIHNGTDLAVPLGTPILAVQDGVVVAARGCQKGCVDPDYGLSGWMIAIDHGGGVVTACTHMLTDSPLQEGDTVTAGQEIGQVGMSGNTTGPHLHFSVFVDGSATDPEPFMEGVGVTLGTLPAGPS